MGWAKNEKTLRITVSVFLCTFELTALLLKGFHLRLHYFTLMTQKRCIPIESIVSSKSFSSRKEYYSYQKRPTYCEKDLCYEKSPWYCGSVGRADWMYPQTVDPCFKSLRYRVAQTHTMPYLYWSCSVKKPYNQWLFCAKWPAIKASYGSSPSCNMPVQLITFHLDIMKKTHFIWKQLYALWKEPYM